MKIVHITSHIGHGGDWTIIRTLMEVFQENKHQVMIAGCRASATQFDDIEIPLNQGAKGFLQSLFKLGKIPKDTDIAHAHSPASLLFALSLKYLRCPSLKIIFTYHWQTADSSLKRKIKGFLFNWADIIHSYSKDIFEVLAKEYQVDSAKNYLCYVGANPNRFRVCTPKEKQQFRDDDKINQETFVLLFAGRLSIEKNIGLILKYLASRQGKDLLFLLAGDGPLKEHLQQEIKTLKIENSVRFLGRVNNIEQVYALSDLLVLPSSAMETFGMVVIEAAFCGIPTLRSNLPGARDQINHGEDGFIFPIQEPEKMFTILDQIVEQRSTLPEVGQKARDRALKNFTLEKMYESFLTLYGANNETI